MGEVTIKELAKICGVGVSTISRAINNHPDINKETKEMIMSVSKEYGYIPNNSARNLKVSETNTIGVLVKGRNNHFFQGMYTFIEQELQKVGYDITLKEISWDDNNTDKIWKSYPAELFSLTTLARYFSPALPGFC